MPEIVAPQDLHAAPLLPSDVLPQAFADLLNSISHQLDNNTQVLTKIQALSDLSGGQDARQAVHEIAATFIEYRKTLHERFGIIHQQIGHIDEEVELLVERVRTVENNLELQAKTSTHGVLLVLLGMFGVGFASSAITVFTMLH